MIAYIKNIEENGMRLHRVTFYADLRNDELEELFTKAKANKFFVAIHQWVE